MVPLHSTLDLNILSPFQTIGLGDVWVGFLRHSPTDGNQLPQAAESILRAGSLWASHSRKSLAARAGKARERIRRVEVKPNQNKISMILTLIIELTYKASDYRVVF